MRVVLRATIAAIGITALGLLAFPAAAQTTTYTVSPAQDSHISSGTPNTNFGTSTTLNVKGGATDTALALVQFTLPTIPFDEVINGATLRLVVASEAGPTPSLNWTIHRVTDTWTESTVTWTNTGSDFEATSVASASGSYGSTLALNVKSLVDRWKAGTAANNGFLINSGTQDTSRFYSKEDSTSSRRPLLTITTNTIPVPVASFAQPVRSDPQNGTVAPKRIPGAIIGSQVTVTNTGRGAGDTNAISVDITVPANSRMFVGDVLTTGSGPVVFTQGTPSSNTTFSYGGLSSPTDDVAFSNDGAIFTYTPVPDVQGYDAAVKAVRISTKGTFAGASGSGNPNYTAEIRSRLN